jgi:hypothetical protein
LNRDDDTTNPDSIPLSPHGSQWPHPDPKRTPGAEERGAESTIHIDPHRGRILDTVSRPRSPIKAKVEKAIVCQFLLDNGQGLISGRGSTCKGNIWTRPRPRPKCGYEREIRLISNKQINQERKETESRRLKYDFDESLGMRLTG